MIKPQFLVTIDTEGDNGWALPRVDTTANSAYLPRFQALCEKYGLKPTYLTNYEMALCPVFREFGRHVVRAGTAEIGMHLHAWNSPPLVALTARDHIAQPYLIEYPERVLREKVRYLTGLLEDTFGVSMVSHRAGRWAFNSVYARALVDCGYKVDCSVTPYESWEWRRPAPQGSRATDYTRFPVAPYFMDLNEIGKPGRSTLLEVPMTIRTRWPAAIEAGRRLAQRSHMASRVFAKYMPLDWFRPNGNNSAGMIRLANRVASEPDACLEFMLHSSELMPGGSPTFPSAGSIERLYTDLEATFAAVTPHFTGATLSDFYSACTRKQSQQT